MKYAPLFINNGFEDYVLVDKEFATIIPILKGRKTRTKELMKNINECIKKSAETILQDIIATVRVIVL